MGEKQPFYRLSVCLVLLQVSIKMQSTSTASPALQAKMSYKPGPGRDPFFHVTWWRIWPCGLSPFQVSDSLFSLGPAGGKWSSHVRINAEGNAFKPVSMLVVFFMATKRISIFISCPFPDSKGRWSPFVFINFSHEIFLH